MKFRTSMGRLRRPSATVRFAAGASVAVLLATLLSANVLANSNKPFLLGGTYSGNKYVLDHGVPKSIAAGPNANILISITDNTKTQQLGSLQIALPVGFSFVADGSDSYASATSPDSVGPVTTSGSSTTLLQFQNLNLQPGDTAELTIVGIQAPGCTPLQWNFTAQQANQWTSGNGANYLTLTGGYYSDGSSITTSQPTSAGNACALSFSVSPAVEPADAGANQTITNTPLTPSGTPVTVQVIDATTQLPIPVVTDVTLSLNTVRLDTAGGTPTLTGAGPVTTDATGKATFSASINVGGTFTLTATASNAAITSATSNQFRIWGDACTGACAFTLGSTSTTNGETFDVSSTSTTGAVGASVDIAAFDCSNNPQYPQYPYGGVPALPGTHTATWTAVAPSSGSVKTMVITIPNSILTAAVSTSSTTTNVLDTQLEVHYMVCMSAPYSFPVAWSPAGPSGTASLDPQMTQLMNLNGTQVSWYRGLLPDCQDLEAQATGSSALWPCVVSRVHLTGGLQVTVQAPSAVNGMADPFGR